MMTLAKALQRPRRNGTSNTECDEVFFWYLIFEKNKSN